MRYKTVLFDFDGTLVDSAPGILATLKIMMEELQLPPWPEEKMYLLIGPPFSESFPQYFHMNEEETQHAVSIFRKHFPRVHEDPKMVQPFPGIRELLQELREAGIFVGLVSSKIRFTAEEQLQSLGLAPYVDHIGCTTDRRGGNKEALLKKTLEELSLTEDVVMVGDRLYDLNAANALHIDSIGVLYGYGSEEELCACHPTALARSVSELRKLLLS